MALQETILTHLHVSAIVALREGRKEPLKGQIYRCLLVLPDWISHQFSQVASELQVTESHTSIPEPFFYFNSQFVA